MLTLLTTARGNTEAVLLVARLRDAGIACMRGGADGPRGTPRSAREIYVDEASLPRAQEILEEDRSDFDEDELARVSEEAAQHWAQRDSPAAESTADTANASQEVVQAATTVEAHHKRRLFGRLSGRDTSRDPFGR